KVTRAAHKLPENWEDQCKQSAFRKAYKIKEYNIPAELFINSNQTQMLYAPGDKLTWAETGSSQVSVLGAEEKHAFTVTVGVTASGRALPFQAVYVGSVLQSSRHTTRQHWMWEFNSFSLELICIGLITKLCISM
ncbi:hypothetical protein BT96DRAFT_832650, partial [Gymnopus androsaceus JB14]